MFICLRTRDDGFWKSREEGRNSQFRFEYFKHWFDWKLLNTWGEIMAGINQMFFVGGQGGVLGADGINPIYFQIWVGDANRQWLEVHYVDRSLQPMGKVTRFVPRRPNDPVNIMDACLLFYPEHFAKCSLISVVAEKLKDTEFVDFDLEENVPKEWPWLRYEARPYFEELGIFSAKLEPYSLPTQEELRPYD